MLLCLRVHPVAHSPSLSDHAACPVRRGVHLEPPLQLSATVQVRWVSKSRVICLTLEEMHEPGEPARPPMITKRDDP